MFLLVLSVGLEHTSYTVVKNDELIEVCNVVAPDGCFAAFPFWIRFRTYSDSAGILYMMRKIFT